MLVPEIHGKFAGLAPRPHSPHRSHVGSSQGPSGFRGLMNHSAPNARRRAKVPGPQHVTSPSPGETQHCCDADFQDSNQMPEAISPLEELWSKDRSCLSPSELLHVWPAARTTQKRSTWHCPAGELWFLSDSLAGRLGPSVACGSL